MLPVSKFARHLSNPQKAREGIRKQVRTFSRLIIALMLVPSLASACDFCGCFNPGLEAPSTWKDLSLLPWANNGPYAAVAEQFTHFGTLQFDGHEVSNPTGQYLDSSVTQLVAGYTFTDRVALQLDAPLIYRSFRRPEGFRIDE